MQVGLTLILVVKAFGSVKHEGPSTSKRQIGEICQDLYTEDFTSFCHLLVHTRTSHCTRKAYMKLHASESPHVCLENDSYELPVKM